MSSDPQPSPDTVPDEQQVSPPPKRRALLLAVIAVVVLALDVVTKSVVVATLAGHEPVRILGGLVYLQLIRNPFAAFGMGPTGGTWIFGIVAIGVVVALIWFAGRLRSVGWAVGLGLILAGAAGNLADRLFRAPGVLRGHVVDFVSLFAPNGDVWPVFNVADSAICVGGVLIVLLSLLGREYDGTVKGRAKR
ncbi:signal peptidase II [Amycolatopsis thermophila]|uniref:Lipoprotein signal peptidase n=1 Tax=Amycolatopsis thermophila TaxID=206084 RepID=A0ABU0F5J9_9PSEU|nr:signal peptidase II [Amycolatopsis thermophila]MDQ0382312.1 signal peptidase II [Amycolatopsis thermophila]